MRYMQPGLKNSAQCKVSDMIKISKRKIDIYVIMLIKINSIYKNYSNIKILILSQN